MGAVIVAPKARRLGPRPAGGAGAEEMGALIPKSPAYWEISVRIAVESGVEFLVASLVGSTRKKQVLIPELELRKLARMVVEGARLREIVDADLPYWRALPKYVRRELARTVIPILALFLAR